MRWLAVLFLVVPLVELWLLLRVGDVLGFWPTLGMVVGAALLGAWLAKREGLRVLRSWQRAVAEMRVPEEGVTSGLLVLVGAVLLVTPGVLTDFVGIALLVPVTRRMVAKLVEHRVTRFISVGSPFAVGRGSPWPGARAGQSVLDVDGQSIDEDEPSFRAGRLN